MSGNDTIRIDLLLFSVGGVHFGADAGQVTGIAVYDGEQAEELFWFHEKMGYGDREVVYDSPTVVTIRSDKGSPYRVVIDSMEDIAEFSQDDISLFPAMLEPFSMRMGMWGILQRHGEMVLLLDLPRLLKKVILKNN